MNINIVAGSSIESYDVHRLVTCKFNGVAVQLYIVQATPLRAHNLPRICALNCKERVMMNIPVYHRVIPIRNTIIAFNKVVVINFCVVNGQLHTVPCTTCSGIHINCIVMNPDGLNACRGGSIAVNQGDGIVNIVVIDFVTHKID